jgi:hypothetical protein
MTTVIRQVHFSVQRKSKRMRVGMPPERAPIRPGRIPRISKLMALAIKFDGLLREGTISNLTELAELSQVTQPRMTQIMNLLHLSPAIQEEILFLPEVERGRDQITERDLRPLVQIMSWTEQRKQWETMSTESKKP